MCKSISKYIFFLVLWWRGFHSAFELHIRNRKIKKLAKSSLTFINSLDKNFHSGLHLSIQFFSSLHLSYNGVDDKFSAWVMFMSYQETEKPKINQTINK